MTGSVFAQVFRYDPERDREPRYDEFLVPAEEEMSVLVLLNRIQQEMDPTLAFRSFCCGLQMCRSCLMRINKRRRYACLTLVAPGEKVIVEPASFPDGHVRDLVIMDGSDE